MATKTARKAAKRVATPRPGRPGLTLKQAAFVREYLIDLNATQAAIRAGYSKRSAAVIAAETLLNPNVAAELQKAMEARAARTEIDADWVLKRWVRMVEADPNELIQYRRGACPSCWPAEAWETGLENEPLGGSLKRDKDDRWIPSGDPNPACPACHGVGGGHVWVADTRNLSDSAKAIYAGVKLGKDGLQVLMHDQPAALLNVARHLGMFIERKEVDLRGAMNVTFNDEEADF